jgi:hypothetical protein
MRQALRYIFLLVIILSSQAGYAQQMSAEVDTVKQREPLRLKSVQLGADVFNMGRGLLQNGKQHYEFYAALEVSQWMLTVDYGQVKFPELIELTQSSEPDLIGTKAYNYQSQGSFFRFGLDKNLLKNSPHAFFVGGRYGLANFSEEVSYDYHSEVFGAYSKKSFNESVSGSWLELVSGLKVQLFKPLMMGYTVRLKFRAKTGGGESMATYHIPGYGKVGSSAQASFHYYLIFRIPFKD